MGEAESKKQVGEERDQESNRQGTDVRNGLVFYLKNYRSDHPSICLLFREMKV